MREPAQLPLKDNANQLLPLFLGFHAKAHNYAAGLLQIVANFVLGRSWQPGYAPGTPLRRAALRFKRVCVAGGENMRFGLPACVIAFTAVHFDAAASSWNFASADTLIFGVGTNVNHLPN